jgi:hypothetical protein
VGFLCWGPTSPGWVSTAANHGEWDAIYGFVQNKAQALLDVNFYKVRDDQKGEMMFQKFITVFIVTAAIAFAASGLPLSSIFGAGSGSGFFNLSLIF